MSPRPPFKPPRSPSRTLATLLAQHEALRRLAFEAERLARRAQRGRVEEVGPMRAVAVTLATTLLEHLEDEEAWVLPLLGQADAWGPVRTERLLSEHETQRATAAALARQARDADPAGLARNLRKLADTLLQDMRQEELDFLQDRVLRDDVVAIDQTDG